VQGPGLLSEATVTITMELARNMKQSRVSGCIWRSVHVLGLYGHTVAVSFMLGLCGLVMIVVTVMKIFVVPIGARPSRFSFYGQLLISGAVFRMSTVVLLIRRVFSSSVLYFFFGFLITMMMIMLIFRVLTPYTLIGRYQRFGETYFLRLQG
jgi:hypothetical protein